MSVSTLFKRQGKIRATGEDAVGFVVYYAEISINTTKAKVYLDFAESNRNEFSVDADLVASNYTDKPLRQIRVTNDGTADFIRVGFNGGKSQNPYIKIKFGETLTMPFIDTDGLLLDMVIKADTTNATVRVIGLG